MKNFLLVVFAIMLFVPFFIFGYAYHLYKEIRFKHGFSMGDYNSNVAYSLDCTGCTLAYNVRGHTLSAMCVEREHWWFEYLINLLFWDKYHCKDQHYLEFNTRIDEL